MVLFCYWYSEWAYIWICSASLTCNMVTSGPNPTKIFSQFPVFERTRANVNNYNPLRLHYLLRGGGEHIWTTFTVYRLTVATFHTPGLEFQKVLQPPITCTVGESTKPIVVTTGTSASGGRFWFIHHHIIFHNLDRAGHNLITNIGYIYSCNVKWSVFVGLYSLAEVRITCMYGFLIISKTDVIHCDSVWKFRFIQQ